jgi:hypothetical protein
MANGYPPILDDTQPFDPTASYIPKPMAPPPMPAGASAPPMPDASALPAASTTPPHMTDQKQSLWNMHPATDPAEGQARHAAKMRDFGDAENAVTSGMLKSPDEFANPLDYSRYIENLHKQKGSIREAKAAYELSHPWGSMESAHPGMWGKVGHAFGEIGNVAGEALAPGLAEAIPGSREHLLAQEVKGQAEAGGAIKEESESAAAGLKGQQAVTEATKPAVNVARASELGAKEAKEEAQTGQIGEPHKPDEQVMAAMTKIGQGKGTDTDMAVVKAYHDLQQAKAASKPEKDQKIEKEYEAAIQAGDTQTAQDLLKIMRDTSAAKAQPQKPPQALGINPEGTAVAIRPGTQVEPGTRTETAALKGASPDEQRRADLARNLNENLDRLEEIVKRRPELFGKAAGRLTSLRGVIGTDDNDIATMQQIKENTGMAMVGAHAMRNAQHVETAANSVFNAYKNGPNATLAAIQNARNSAKTFQEDVGDEPGSAPKKATGAPKAAGGGQEIHWKVVNGKLVKQ